MHKVKIFRKKSFFGCFATYLIIVGYDIDRFKQLIKEINSYYKDNVKDLNKEKYYHNEIDNLKYYELKSGQTIEFDVDDGSTVFVNGISNLFKRTSVVKHLIDCISVF